jgi:hypothetical protein
MSEGGTLVSQRCEHEQLGAAAAGGEPGKGARTPSRMATEERTRRVPAHTRTDGEHDAGNADHDGRDGNGWKPVDEDVRRDRSARLVHFLRIARRRAHQPPSRLRRPRRDAIHQARDPRPHCSMPLGGSDRGTTAHPVARARAAPGARSYHVGGLCLRVGLPRGRVPTL